MSEANVTELLKRLQEVLDCAPVILYDKESDSYACAFCGDIQTNWIHAKDCKWAALEKAYEAMEGQELSKLE
jgi:hypothetical protein